MAEDGPRARTVIDAQSHPRLPPHIKLRHDAARGRWLLLAPERVLTPDDTAVAILVLCDGTRSVQAIAQSLAESYDASAEQIQADVVELLQGLADKGYVKA